jgi:hypothetical protein
MGLANYVRSKRVAKIMRKDNPSLKNKILVTKYAAKSLIKRKPVDKSLEKYMLKKSDFNSGEKIKAGSCSFSKKDYSIDSLMNTISERKYSRKHSVRTVYGGLAGGLTAAAYLSMHACAAMSFVFAPLFVIPAIAIPRMKKYKF